MVRGAALRRGIYHQQVPARARHAAPCWPCWPSSAMSQVRVITCPGQARHQQNRPSQDAAGQQEAHRAMLPLPSLPLMRPPPLLLRDGGHHQRFRSCCCRSCCCSSCLGCVVRSGCASVFSTHSSMSNALSSLQSTERTPGQGQRTTSIEADGKQVRGS